MSEDELNHGIPDNEILKLSEKEHSFLRRELAHLKDCQIKFLTFSVTATGIILGMVGRSRMSLSEGPNFPTGNMWLLPLVVLLPAWWVFFDKATTITRIVGYFRILEKIILKKIVLSNFPGWERGLSEFRKIPTEEKINYIKLLKILTLQTSNRYWVITYYIFLSLSSLCLFVGWKQSPTVIKAIAGSAILISAIWNVYILWALSEGHCSYNTNEKKWKMLLQVSEK